MQPSPPSPEHCNALTLVESRAEVGLITAGIGWAPGATSDDIYALLVVVLFTTLVTPVLLKISLPAGRPDEFVSASTLASEMAEGS